ALLMEIFNHLSEKVTLGYIGVNQDAMDKAMTRFKI
ncbi:site-specific integrase, partial [Bacillus cereus]|nr:site-specific integrase [Bacillus cereus]